MTMLKPIDNEPVMIQEVEGEPQPVGLPRSLQKLSEEQRQRFIVEALRGKQDEQRAA